jgi:FAD/FMN-containing dehydrogenase
MIKTTITNWVNDIHSQLNLTQVDQTIAVTSIADIINVIDYAQQNSKKISIAGGRHAMGGQQFGDDCILLDINNMNRVLSFNQINGTITVESGITWRQIITYLSNGQIDSPKPWTIAQKQTGCDDLSIGGSVSANMHGRGLHMKPFIENIISLTLILPDGQIIICNRNQNAELFRLVIGGYGLFAIIYSVTIQLIPFAYLKRKVQLTDADHLLENMEVAIKEGASYGDFQFAIDSKSNDFINKGILSTYHPAQADPNQCHNNKLLTEQNWQELLYLAHTDKKMAFEKYAKHYLATNGQIYRSDIFQLSTYISNYHDEIDKKLNCDKSSEIISELYVPRRQIGLFLKAAGQTLRAHKANIIYGTVRFIEEDNESYLAWAKQNYACTVFNLHSEHNEQALKHTSEAFRELIDLAISFKGSFYLTYHRFATKDQINTCYPQFASFLAQKLKYDPKELLTSNWYRWYRSQYLI